MGPSRKASPPTVAPGLALLSMAVLVLEIAWTRILSVTLWYHFAYMVLSTALFGIGFAGVVLSLRRRAEEITDGMITFFSMAAPVWMDSTGYSSSPARRRRPRLCSARAVIKRAMSRRR